MEPLSVKEIAQASGGLVIAGDIKTVVKSVSIDTRTLEAGALYIALRGKRLDGHQFVSEAVAKGAIGVMIEKGQGQGFSTSTCPVIEVADTKAALLALAAWYRRRFNPKVVAITGSNGKTTTKEMLAKILCSRFRVVSAPGSFNNEIGVPLTVLRIDRFTEVALFEIEMNELGGTLRLAQLCQPEVGIVTNVADTHLEFMKNRQGVAQEKRELIAALPEGGVAVVNFDDPLVMAMVKSGDSRQPIAVITFGFGEGADVFAQGIKEHGITGSEFLLNGKYPVFLPVPGRHNIANFLAACAAARVLGVEFEAAINSISGFSLPPNRLAVQRLSQVVLIDDCFNANPQSVAVALKVLAASAPKERRLAILGDMLELGDSSERLHQKIGEEAGGCVDRLVVIGEKCRAVIAGAEKAGLPPSRIRQYKKTADVGEELFDIVQEGDTILVKGSRAMSLEKICEMIVRHYGEKTD